MAIELSEIESKFQPPLDADFQCPRTPLYFRNEEFPIEDSFDYDQGIFQQVLNDDLSHSFDETVAFVNNQHQTFASTSENGFENVPQQITQLVVDAPFPSSTPLPVSATSVSASNSTSSGTEISAASKKSKQKCMTKNAIAARENREKKKKESQVVYSKLKLLESEAALYKKKYEEIVVENLKLQERNLYLEAVVANMPQVAGLIEHFQRMPGMNMTHAVMHCDTQPMLNDHNNNPSPPGICFHVKGQNQMSLQFCHLCHSKGLKNEFPKWISISIIYFPPEMARNYSPPSSVWWIALNATCETPAASAIFDMLTNL